MNWQELGEMLHQPLTQLAVLGVVLFYYCVCYSARVAGGKRRTKKQGVEWSWERFWNDIADRLQAVYLLVAVIIGIDMTEWLAPLIGITLDETVAGVLNVAMIIALPFIAGLAELYAAAKNAFKLWGWSKNIKSLNMTEENFENVTQEHYEEIAETAGKFLETILKKTVREQLEEDGVDVEAIEGEIVEIGMGSGDTYPEPYRSKKKDSMVDPSSCYNREAQPAGTMITMADGSYKEVENIKVDDLLWNHDGSGLVKVKSLWEDSKVVYTIRTGLGDIRFTGEHPLYVRKNKWKVLPRGNKLAYGKAEFVKVRDLKVGDKVYIPELEGEHLPLSDNELRWLGFYLGDGTRSGKSEKNYSYRLCVADGRKAEYVDSLGIEGSYSKHSKSEVAKFFTLAKKSHPELRKVLDEIDGKSFPMLVIPAQAKFIVEGFLEADGCHLYGDVYTASSTDKKLLLAIQRMVISMGGTMAIHKRYDEGELEKFGQRVYAKTLWEASVNLKPKRSMVHEFNDGKFATITKIDRGEIEKVYNIEVSGSHTYIADNHGVHNCVSYTAWKLCEVNGKWPTRTGAMSAKYWVDRLPSWGYKMVSAPKNGGKYIAVLTSGQYGHVMWFEQLIDLSTAQISEYNYNSNGNFNVRNVPILNYIWYEIEAPKGSQSVTKTEEKKQNGFEAGDTVVPIKYVDYDGKKLYKTSNYYTITAIKGNRAVLNDKDGVYAAVNTDNLKLVGLAAEVKDKSGIEQGDKVVPTRLVDYNGAKLTQYDPEYTVAQKVGDRVVLMARGVVWAAMRVEDVKKA